MSQNVAYVLSANSGIRLDIGCGANKHDGFVGIDVLDLPGVDIVHDVLKFPWPLPDGCATFAMSSHLVEHIPPFMPDPKLIGLIDLLLDRGIITQADISTYIGDYEPKPIFIRFMDEVWRILKPGSEFMLSLPHGYSAGFLQDPTHCNPCNENTWRYFDPEATDGGLLYNFYKPKPWRLKALHWSPATNIEVAMVKREVSDD